MPKFVFQSVAGYNAPVLHIPALLPVYDKPGLLDTITILEFEGLQSVLVMESLRGYNMFSHT